MTQPDYKLSDRVKQGLVRLLSIENESVSTRNIKHAHLLYGSMVGAVAFDAIMTAAGINMEKFEAFAVSTESWRLLTLAHISGRFETLGGIRVWSGDLGPLFILLDDYETNTSTPDAS